MTTSLELSKKLYEAGLKIKTEKWCYIHKKISDPDYKDCQVIIPGDRSILHPPEHWDRYPAYSCEELLEVLPKEDFYVCQCRIWAGNHPVDINYYDVKLQKLNYTEAFGKLALYFLTNGYHFNPETGRIER